MPPPGTFSHRQIWRLVMPLILSNLAVPLVGAVDTAVAGHLPMTADLAAVAVGATVFNTLYWSFGFLRMGTTGLTAQAVGAAEAGADDGEIRAGLIRGLLVAGAIGLILVALQVPLGRWAIAWLDPDPAVATAAHVYFDWRIWGAPLVLAHYVLAGWLIGVRDTMGVLGLQMVVAGANIALDLVLVPGLGLGVAGIGLATALAWTAGTAYGLVRVRRHLRRRPGRVGRAALVDPARLRRLVAVNGDIFLRTLALLLAFYWFTRLGAGQGATVLAANLVLLNFQYLMAYALDGFANAAETLVGAALGRRDRHALEIAVRRTSLWALITAAGFLAVYVVAGPLLIAALTDLPAVRATAERFLPWVQILPALAVWSFQLDGIFIGATRTREMRNGMLISVALFIAAAEILVPWWGNHGLWAAMTILMVARAALLALWYPRIPAGVPPH